MIDRSKTIYKNNVTMKKILFACLLSLFFFDGGIAQSKDYQIPDINIEVQITEDGVVRITEQRTYQFRGSFSWADYRLPKRGFAEMRDIQVAEQNSSFLNENTEEPGTFTVSESDDDIVIKWHYNASDTTRIFAISYELTDALSVGPNWTEFFWNYVAAGREKSTANLDITILLSETVSADFLYAWPRGAVEQVDIQQNPGSYKILADAVPRSQSVQIRTLFPTSVFDMNSVSVTDPGLTLESVQEDEEDFREEQAAQAERKAFYSSITQEVTILICLISIGIFLLLYRKYGQRYPTGTISDRETVLIPSSIPPAIIGRLMVSNSTTGQHLVASLFDLARRGWFTIHEEEKEKKGFFTSDKNQFRIEQTDDSPDEELPDWERMVVDFVNEQIESGHVYFDKLFKANSSKMSKWFSKWKKEVNKIFKQKNWVDKQSYKGMFINLVLQIFLLAASIVIMILGNPEFAFIGMIVSLIMMIASFAIIRRTREGEETYKRWKAYRRGLKNADKRTLRMEMLDRHFIYALAFHLSEKQIKTVVESVADPDRQVFHWIVLIGGSSHTPASVASSLSTLAASGTSSVSSVSGGAGASAGAAGGGASGGAG